MKSEKLDVADLLADESFINFCKRSSAQDVAAWETYLEENPERRAVIVHAREKFIELFNALGQADLDEQVTRLSNRMEALELPAQAPVVQMETFEDKKKPGSGFTWLRIAAALLALAGLFFVFNYIGKGGKKGSKTFLAAYGERKNIQLPDGSDVTLNAGSKIEIRENFGASGRDVYLEGEAFFDVKHNDKLPFVVHTQAMDVKALGTAFNVKAYSDERITETSLIRGLVEVTLKESNNRTMLLYPSQKIKWEHYVAGSKGASAIARQTDSLRLKDSLVKKVFVTDHGDVKEIAWKENKLVFDDDLFSDIAVLLERWYGVEIEFRDDSLRDYHFSSTFEKEDINTVLEYLRESRKFSYKIEEGDPLKIYLSR